MIASRFRHRRRRLWVFIGSGAMLASVLLFVIGAAGGASLPGSSFEIDTDANLVVTTSGNIDWLNASGTPLAFRTGVNNKADLASGSGDDSLGNGTKEADAVPTVIDGSIPPNKSDLKNFGIYIEKTATTSYMNLFWTRVQDPSGTTNMDFEFNQSSTVSSNGVTPVRAAGDLLIEYHLDNGGSVATLSLRTWDGSAWGNETALTGSAIGAINSSAITAANSGGLGSLSPRTFGEASINMSTILPSGQCRTFGSAYLKSRSADSFTSAVKDFIAPLTANITNCGSVLVKKTDFNSGAALDGATFTVAKGVVTNGVEAASSNVPHVGATGSGLYCVDNLFFGNHTVTETAAPPGYDKANPDNQVVNVSDNGTCAARIAAATVTPDATFRDPPILGAITITKTGKDKRCVAADNPDADCSAASTRLLSGVVFEIKQGTTVVATSGATDADGVVCVSGLALGSYTVHEKAANVPAGYSAAADQTAAVTASGTCASGSVPKSFVDTPLSKITVSFESKVAPGATTATIQCTGEGSAANLPEGTPKELDDLVPGSYACTVIVDP
jgi:prealbumin domain-containing protein